MLGKKVKVKHNLSLTGVDEDVIIAVLVKRNNEQRQKIKVVYEASTGEVSNSFLIEDKCQRQDENKRKQPKVKVYSLKY